MHTIASCTMQGNVLLIRNCQRQHNINVEQCWCVIWDNGGWVYTIYSHAIHNSRAGALLETNFILTRRKHECDNARKSILIIWFAPLLGRGGHCASEQCNQFIVRNCTYPLDACELQVLHIQHAVCKKGSLLFTLVTWNEVLFYTQSSIAKRKKKN